MTNEDHGPRRVVGSTVRIILSGADTEGAFALVEDVTPPGGGPPPHVHHNEDEGFYVLEGEVEFLAGDRWFRGGAGTNFSASEHAAHLQERGLEAEPVPATIAPAGFESFFVEVDRLRDRPPTPDLLIELGKRFGLSSWRRRTTLLRRPLAAEREIEQHVVDDLERRAERRAAWPARRAASPGRRCRRRPPTRRAAPG